MKSILDFRFWILDSRLGRMGLRATALATALLLLAGCGVSIHDAVGQKDRELVEAMLAENPEFVNARTTTGKAKGKTPLHYAVTYGAEDLIDLLVGKGADVNAVDDTGLTPLHVAAMIRRVKEAELLIGHGAGLEARDKFGDTPFHYAALHGQLRMVQLLLEAGADPHTVNNAGLSPLESAVQNRKQDVVEFLRHLDDWDD